MAGTTVKGYTTRKQLIREAKRTPRRVVICPTRTPEVHELGEFPMTCYRCHVEADS